MLLELALIFLRLGTVSFGGPLAHIALMRQEFVERRQWLSNQEFLDFNSVVNLVPGPNSTEVAMHVGHKRAGNAGLWVAGCSFIFPALVMMLVLAMFYARYGTLPASRRVMWGISPVVVAIMLQALQKFAPVALKSRFAIAVAISALLAAALGAGEISIIFAAAGLGLLMAFWESRSPSPPVSLPDNLPENASPVTEASDPPRPQASFWLLAPASLLPASVAAIFWSFFKIGVVIYGSGYVLLAYLRAEFVEKLAWITDRQLLDAIAVGQMTPGPLFTTATFLGYQFGGVAGALAATAGIFLPSFGFVMLAAKFLGRMSGSPRARTFLDAVGGASFALMAIVIWQLARASLWSSGKPSGAAALILLLAVGLLWKTRLNSMVLLLGGALLGFFWGPR